MSLYGALFAGVSGITAQGIRIGVISNNIANINTTGYKAGDVSFSSLVTDTSEGTGGGAISNNRPLVTQQGLIQATGVSSDIAIQGSGFLVVRDGTDSTSDYFYTRAGSFRQDNRGNFVNAAGYFLRAWPLDTQGRLPGETGNLNTTSSQLLQSLKTVNTRDVSGLAFATTTISIGANLNADTTVLAGAGDSIDFATGETANDGISSTEIIVPDTDSAGSDLTTGDVLTISTGLTGDYTFTYGGFAESENIATANSGAGILGATTTTGIFSGATDGDYFTITYDGTDYDFTLNKSNPNVNNSTFNSLVTLAAAIEDVSGLTARVANNRLYVSAENANDAFTITNGTGTFISEFQAAGGFASVTASSGRFNTLDGLKTIIDNTNNISASLSNPTGEATMRIYADDPLDTIQFVNTTGNTGNILTATGLTATELSPVYDATGTSGDNMASGTISPHFSRNIRVYDSKGTGHDLRMTFVKVDNNKWALEVYAATGSEIADYDADSPQPLAYGTVEFNGDGTLNNKSSTLESFEVIWANDAVPSTILLDLGTEGEPAGTSGASSIGLADGLSQFAGPFSVQFAEQDGAGAGSLNNLEINAEGLVIANFDNGQSRAVFKIPLASFPNANGLFSQPGNAYSQSDGSGEFTLKEAGDPGVGVFSVAALESANVELADELTEIIIAQRSYQAATKVITLVDELLQELNRNT
ncbi:MAG: flagellar hook-basal body complex protein [Rickettsiales bacterium]|nr:flagellar hook-basal body complex protein [Rickettsiales bacterium]